MSLINDALKRASNKKRNENGEAPTPAPTFQHSYAAASLIPVLLVIIVLAAAGYGGWKWYSKKNAAAAAATTNQTAKIPATAKPATNNPIARAQNTLAAVTARNDIENTNARPAAPVATTPSTTAAKTVQPSTPSGTAASPDLKLQAIYYRLRNPSAVINGKTYNVGQQVDGARIVTIERHSVTIDFNGRTRVLTLK